MLRFGDRWKLLLFLGFDTPKGNDIVGSLTLSTDEKMHEICGLFIFAILSQLVQRIIGNLQDLFISFEPLAHGAHVQPSNQTREAPSPHPSAIFSTGPGGVHRLRSLFDQNSSQMMCGDQDILAKEIRQDRFNEPWQKKT